LNKLFIIKILLAFTICFQLVAPCLSLFVSSKDLNHHGVNNTSYSSIHTKKNKSLSFQSRIHLQIWAMITKHQCHLPPASPRLKAMFWMSLFVGLLFVAFLNITEFVSRKWHQSTVFDNILKRPIYLLLGQLTV